MPFGVGFGELVLILLIVGAVVGSTRFPGAGDSLGDWLRNQGRLGESRPNRRRWTLGEWILLATTVVLAACVLSSIVHALCS